MFKKSNDRLGNLVQDKDRLGQPESAEMWSESQISIPQIILSGYIRLSQLSPLSTCQSSKVSSIMSDVPANYLVYICFYMPTMIGQQAVVSTYSDQDLQFAWQC